ncbi:MAG TPA: PaaI family thioesterase [Candidatus Sulfotelmatobacter sp.]|nr:PaaI family thioesterase [Candidatus Sulfotelmatobacter sp.]
MRRGIHAACVVCGSTNGRGLRVPYRALSDGSVEAEFACDESLEGYPHLLHGGVIASLLDGAMTNCLFAHGITAVTAELSIRYRDPVPTEQPVTVRARIQRSAHGCHFLTAEVRRHGRAAVIAHGKFLSRDRELR